MSLITCPECGQKISDKAFACPHCGYPFSDIISEGKEMVINDEAQLGSEKEMTDKQPTSPNYPQSTNYKQDIDNIRQKIDNPDHRISIPVESDFARINCKAHLDSSSSKTTVVTHNSTAKKKRSIVGWLILIFLIFGIIAFLVLKDLINTKKMQDKIVEICSSYNLSNIEVFLSGYHPPIDTQGYTFFEVNVLCNGFSSLDSEQMYECFLKINNADQESYKSLITDSDISITSDGHKYSYNRGDYRYGESGIVYCDGSKVFEKTYPKTNTSPGESTYSPDSGARHTDVEAFTIAEIIVESYLKSPSTAKFCKIYEATITNQGDKYTVKGWVDAQNAFGATIRQCFTVTYTATKSGLDVGYKNANAIFS